MRHMPRPPGSGRAWVRGGQTKQQRVIPFLSPEKLRPSGNQTNRLDMSEEQKGVAVLMARAFGMGSRLERTRESGL